MRFPIRQRVFLDTVPALAAVASALTLAALLGAGCASGQGKGSVAIETAEVTAPAQAWVGRVLSVEPGNGLAVIRIVPQLGVPDFFEGERLVTRNEQGRQTARLLGSGQRQGPILGAYIVAGKPQVDDEVWVESKSVSWE